MPRPTRGLRPSTSNLRLARAFTRGRALRRAGTLVIGVISLLVAMFVVLQALTASGPQLVKQHLGRYDARMGLGGVVDVRGDYEGVTAALTAAETAGAGEPSIVLETYGVEPVGGSAVAFYSETDWASEPFPDRYRLLNGRWPVNPGEVAITAALDTGTEGDIAVLSGQHALSPTGVVLDRYAEGSTQFFAAPGTWRSFPWGALTDRFPNLSASPALLWSGAESPAAVEAVAREIVLQTETPGMAGTVEQLMFQTQTRPDLLALGRRGYVQTLPIAFTLPSVLLPALTVVAAFAISARRWRRSADVLAAIGVPDRDVGRALALGGSALFSASAVAGIAVGSMAGAALLPVLDRFFFYRPLSGFPDVTPAAFNVLTSTIFGCLAASTVLVHRMHRRAVSTRQPALRLATAVTSLRRTGSIIAAATTALLGTSATGLVDALWVLLPATVCVALLSPDIARTSLRLLPEQTASTRWARRLLAQDVGRVAISLTLVAAVVGPSLAMATILDSLRATDDEERTSLVPEAQIVVTANDLSQSPPEEVVDLVVDAVQPDQAPIQVSFLGSATREILAPGDTQAMMVVQSVDAADRLAGDDLSRGQRATLSEGGMLLWSMDGVGQASLTELNEETQDERATPEIAAHGGDFDASWESRTGGLMLDSTADSLGFPSQGSDIVLTGVSDDDIGAARQAILDAGYDRRFVGTYGEQAALVAPLAFVATGVSLFVLVLIALWLSAGANAKTLRPELAQLRSLGFPDAWVRRVLLLQAGWVLLMGVLPAAILAGLPVLVLKTVVPGIVVSVPWVEALGILTTALVASSLAVGLASLRLRPAERFGHRAAV